MKTMLPLRLALFGAVVLITQTTFAQTWQTVDDLRYFGHSTYLNAMTTDPFGNLYAAGNGWGSADGGLITKSSDGGATWSVSDAFSIAASSQYSEYRAVASDGAGNLYALGQGFPYNTALPNHWFVRRSQDHGATWSTVLDVPYTGYIVFPYAIAADSAGNVYVVGPAWAVLKSADAGNSWSVLDAFNPGRSPASLGVFCHPTLGLFVVGHAEAAITTTKGKKTTTTYQPNWYVRRSLNGGATWTTVDAYPKSGTARGIAADAAGNLYVTGDSDNHWLVRKSANGGTTWTTADDFFPIVSAHQYKAFPWSIAADAYGNVFVGGSTAQIISSTASGPAYWTVRKLPAGSTTWQTVDVFQYAPGRSSTARAVVADAFGNVFVGGVGFGTIPVNGSYNWLVRKLVP